MCLRRRNADNLMSSVYLGLGSNQGGKLENIKKAVTLISERVGDILALSGFYKTQPWGYTSSEIYLNAAVWINTMLNPESLLSVTQDIEREVGRKEKTTTDGYHDRIIDIDILLYNDLIIQTECLTIPHPLMHQRLFVLQPLSEIAPDFVHPVFGKTIAELCGLLNAN